MTMHRGGQGSVAAVLLAAALAAAGPVGCANRPISPPPEPPAGGAVDSTSPNYVIGPADVIRVQVWKNPELSAEVPVRPDGKLSVPLLNDVHAAGLTPIELRDIVAQGLAEYVTAPDVTVTVLQVNSKRIYVVGEVLRASAIPLTLDMRVLDAIASVGGFSPYADKGDIRVLRRGSDATITEYRFDYKGFLRGNHPESNLLLEPGDTIVVPD